MGSCFSCRSSSPPFDGIRVVHLSGYVEDFDEPMTVGQVTGKPPKHFICSSAHLLSFGSKPLAHDVELQRGHLYFLLPHSIFHSDSSPVDLVSLATRLSAIAVRGGGGGGSPTPKSKQQIQRSCSPHKKSWIDGTCGEFVSPSVRSWKPLLETIEEKSFRSELDASKEVVMSSSKQ